MDNSSEYAALVTLKKLVTEKKSYEELINDFIIFALIFWNKTLAKVDNISKELENEFNLIVPRNLVKKVLNNLELKGYAKRENTAYTIKFPSDYIHSYDEAIAEYIREKNENEKINMELISFLEEKGIEIEKTSEIFSIYRYLLLGLESKIDLNNKYLKPVGEFILKKNSENPKLRESWDIVKSSMIIREALTYNNVSVDEKFQGLRLYLDMEVLFDAYGFNGSVYKNLFNELFSLVDFLNSKGSNISLYYFGKTRDEIERYFDQALLIFDNRDKLFPQTDAMADIVDNSSDRASVINKKLDFFDFLNKKNIKEIDSNYGVLPERLTGKGLEFEEDLRYRNQEDFYFPFFAIKRLRHNLNCNRLTSLHHLFISRTRTLNDYSRRNLSSKNEIPCTVTPDFVVNNFWFASGKGFESSNCPIPTISFVQRILSTEKRIEIAADYEDFKNSLEANDKEKMCKRIAAYRLMKSRPEEMDQDTCNLSIADETRKLLASQNELQKIKKQNAQIEKETEEIREKLLSEEEKNKKNQERLSITESENKDLKKFTTDLSEKLEEQTEQKEELENNYSKVNLKLGKVLEDYRCELQSLLEIKNKTDEEIKENYPKYLKRKNIIRWIIEIIFAIIFGYFVIAKWEKWKLEPIFLFIEFIPRIVTKISQKINKLKEYLKNIEEKKYSVYRNRKYKKAGVNTVRIKELEEKIRDIEN